MGERSEGRKSKTWIIVVVVIAVLLMLCGCMAVAGIAWLSGGRGWPRDRPLTGISFPNLILQAEATRQVDKTLAVDTPVLLEIENDVGDIEIMGTDEDQVRVQAVVRAYGASESRAEDTTRDAEVIIDRRDDDHIYIVGRNPPGEYRRSPSVTFTIHVPRECVLEVASNMGNVEVQAVEGSMRIRGNVGTIQVHDWVMIDDSDIATNVGKIKVRLPRWAEFYLDAQTNVGRVQTGFDVEVEHERRLGPGDRLEGTVGEDAEARLILRSNTGDVSIREAR